jgi:hypothetical protein
LETVASAELRLAQSSFADTGALRALRLAEIQAGLDRELAAVGLTAQQKLAIEKKYEADRQGVARQFPTFFEQQMQALVNSNTFSMGQMVSTWSGGIAQMAVHGGNLKAAWEQTQVAMVQAALNGGVQMLANMAIHAAQEMAIKTATEQSKTILAAEASAARTAIATQEQLSVTGLVEGSNTAIVASMTATGKAVQSIGGIVLNALSSIVSTVTSILDLIADAAMSTGILLPIGLALKAVSFGIKLFSGGSLGELSRILGGMDLGFLNNIQEFFGFSSMVNLDAIPSVAFADGGIAFGPSIFGEAGPEAAIPLNRRGAAFMSDMLGMGGGGEHTTNIYLDGELIASNTERRIRQRVALEGVFV